MEQNDFDTSLLRCLAERFHDRGRTVITGVSVIPTGEVNASDGYSSETLRVKFNCISFSGHTEKFTAFVKTQRKWKSPVQIARYNAYFRTEIEFYTRIRPMMEGLTNEFNDNRDHLWPEYYGSVPYHLLAIQDLKDLKYVLAERRKENGLDFNHSSLVLRSLGRFHAVGKTLIERGMLREDDVDVGQFRHPTDKGLIAKWTALFQALSRSMATDWGERWIEISEKLEANRNITAKLCELASNYDKRFQVLNHGDVWGANLMFHYEEFANEPVSVKFVDFQMMFVNSFIWDVNTFLYSATSPPIRRKHRVSLYKAYHEALKANLELFSFAGRVPTIEDVLAESDRIAFANLCFLVFGGVNNADCPTPMDMAKSLEGTPADAIDKSVFSDGKFKNTTAEDFINFVELGLL